MRLSIDLVPSDRERRRRDVAWLGLGVGVFLAGAAYWGLASYRLSESRAAFERLQAEVERVTQERDRMRDPSREAEEVRRKDWVEYRDTFPWNDLLNALESLPPLRVRDFSVSVRDGTATVELTGSTAEEVLAGVQKLTSELPEWEIRLRRIAIRDGRHEASIELRDRQRPGKGPDR